MVAGRILRDANLTNYIVIVGLINTLHLKRVLYMVAHKPIGYDCPHLHDTCMIFGTTLFDKFDQHTFLLSNVFRTKRR